MSEDTPESLEGTRAWLAGQVELYRALRPRHQAYAAALEAVLAGATRRLAPLAIVQVRTKSISSFAAKALRKRHKYHDPVRQLTDLCGARVIARTRSEAAAVCRFVEEAFDIDWPNSLDTSRRLAAGEFGYRSVHYIVSFRPGPRPQGAGKVPKELLPDREHPMKAEVQVRTTVEHAYADFAHDLSYKGSFPIPETWQRELASAAAALEAADGTFARIEERLRTYAASYGSYLSEEELRREIALLEIVLEHDPEDAELAARLGKMAITLGDWEAAIGVLGSRVERPLSATPQPVLRDLGVALCQAHRSRPRSREYRRGQRCLRQATELDPGDVDALASLAGTWKGIDDERALELYRRAFEIDPTDPYALGNHLEGELEREPSVLATTRPLIRGGIERCRAHLAVGINLPWALYSLGFFHLLLGEPDDSLDAYARAIQLSPAAFMIETALRSCQRLVPVADRLEGFEWVRRLLLLGLAARFPSPGSRAPVEELATAGATPLGAPQVIVAGGTDPRVQERIERYRPLLVEAFSGFQGTILSGGTTQGVSGLVGDLAAESGGRIHAVSYLPALVPADATVDRDRRRYRELRQSPGQGFSPLEPLQNWVDLIASGVEPRRVRVLGINGGRIAAAEFRIALALGAVVGIVAESGREAGRLLADVRWMGSEGLVSLPPDGPTLRAFLGPMVEPPSEAACGRMAREIHREYRAGREAAPRLPDPALADWEELPEELRASNLEQARHVFEKLERIGCEAVPVAEAGREAEPSADEIEAMARLEHGRYVAERLLAGWRWGEVRDLERRRSPWLVGWEELPEEVRELDRRAVRRIPALLATAGLAMRRKKRRRRGGGR